MAEPLLRSSMADPEFPPVVSTRCARLFPDSDEYGPLWVFCTWFQVLGRSDSVTPYPMMRSFWPDGEGALEARR